MGFCYCIIEINALLFFGASRQIAVNFSKIQAQILSFSKCIFDPCFNLICAIHSFSNIFHECIEHLLMVKNRVLCHCFTPFLCRGQALYLTLQI